MTSRRASRLASVFVSLMLVGGCTTSSRPSPSATIIPGATGGGSLPVGELRLLLVEALGPLWYCDRDSYPVGRDEQQAAIDAWPELQSEGDVFRAVAARLGVNVTGEVDPARKLAVYRLWKQAVAIDLDPAADGAFRFRYLAQPVAGGAEGTLTTGAVRPNGEIAIESQTVAGEPICPICLSAGTRIDTPDGPVAVERLRLGDPVWTLDADGRRVAGVVIARGSTTAPADHHVVRLVLADGREVIASPGHPLTDGRSIGGIRVGDIVDRTAVVAAELLPYAGGSTFDLLVSGATGAYFAGGIPLGSTLRPT